MITSKPIRLQAKGQITIPQIVRKKLNLKKGDLVTFVQTAEGIVVRPAAVVANEALDELAQALTAKGIMLDDILAQGREIRVQLIREKYGAVGT